MSHDAHDAQLQDKLKSTLNLPHTDFPIRPNAKIDDPRMLERWNQENLYEQAFYLNQGKATYILHDGPPYANGHIHLGHAYNKILKDIMTKAYRMAGHHVPVIPGWDCHGLPIELKVVQQSSNLSPLEIKQACRTYAQQWIDVQRAEFKRLGVVMHWNKPYITMDYNYESKIMQAFGILVSKGFIERKNKTVAWCPIDQTTLASAEIEYQERKDPSIYVLFPMAANSSKKLFPELGDQTVNLLVWTTTPWTLPLNRAVAVKPHAMYRLVRLGTNLIIVGAQLVEKIAAMLGSEAEVIKEFSSELLQGLQVQHPFIDAVIVPVIYDEFVGLDEGTACVHIAPGCGPADYELGVKNNLEIYSPITADGKYAAGIVPQELQGISVADGQIWVIKKLAECGRLLHKTSIRHSYPHCWRCHNGLIFRATPQWFFDLQRQGIKENALQAVDHIRFIPEQGRSFLRATVGSRWEWCLSRQRSWGVPIPALICTKCDKAYITPDLIEQVAQWVKQEGIEYWDRVPVNELVSSQIRCGSCNGQSFKKEHDILDVWFDSGVSHFAVLHDNPEQSFPADLYLEGIDQYRGWFQSSLLTSLVLEEEPSMKAIMSHGFTVDGQGRKMSKSLGNVISPQQIIDQLGTDGLRLWVASIGHDSDAVVSETLLKNVSEVYRKVRNTCRFLLQNLYDFEYERDAASIKDLLYIDRIALLQLAQFNQSVQKDYLYGNFTAVFHALADYAASTSSLYLDIIKDRLYVEQADGYKRRSAQTVVWYMLDTLTRLMAPVLSFTAEHLSDFYQKQKSSSIHLQSFADLHHVSGALSRLMPDVSEQDSSANSADKNQWADVYEQQWTMLLDVRSAILKVIEGQREQGIIKHSLEAQVHFAVTEAYRQYQTFVDFVLFLEQHGSSIEEFFKEFLIVSSVELISSPHEQDSTCSPAKRWPSNPEHQSKDEGATDMNGVFAQAVHAKGTKCPRCWHWEVAVHQHGLCKRCSHIVGDF